MGGGPKMAKMQPVKSTDDSYCQKSHFWGVNNFDLFFHLECTIRSSRILNIMGFVSLMLLLLDGPDGWVIPLRLL